LYYANEESDAYDVISSSTKADNRKRLTPVGNPGTPCYGLKRAALLGRAFC